MGTPPPTAVHIARFLGDRDAAASLTFDDGHKAHAGIAALLDAYDIDATFFIVTKWTPAEPYEAPKAKLSWRELNAMAANGHEVGNHSMTHPNLKNTTDPATLELEIATAAQWIAERTGAAPVSYADPFCQGSPATDEWVNQHHAVRRGYCELYEGSCSAAKARTWIDAALAEHRWHVYLSHGINLDALKAHLDDLAPLRDRIWFDTYGRVGCYVKARDAATLTVREQADNRCTFALTLPDTTAPALHNTPLTVVIPAVSPQEAKVTGRDARVETRDDRILVTARPGPGDFTVSWNPQRSTGTLPQ